MRNVTNLFFSNLTQDFSICGTVSEVEEYKLLIIVITLCHLNIASELKSSYVVLISVIFHALDDRESTATYCRLSRTIL